MGEVRHTTSLSFQRRDRAKTAKTPNATYISSNLSSLKQSPMNFATTSTQINHEEKEADSGIEDLFTQLTESLTTSHFLPEEEDDSCSQISKEVIEKFLADSWSIDDEDSATDVLGQDVEEFRQSIRALQEEASRVDKLFAMDQLKSLNQELISANKKLETKDEEIQDLKKLVTAKDEQLATMELERDLYKADAKNTKRDLDSCILDVQTLQKTLSDYRNRDVLSVPREVVIEMGTQESHATPSQISSHRNLPPPSKGDPDMNEEDNAGAKHSPCLPIRCNVSARSKYSRRATNLAISELEDKVEDLTARLKVSMATSAELRRKLVLMAKYYENATEKLKQKVDSIEKKMNLTPHVYVESSVVREKKTRLAREIIRGKN